MFGPEIISSIERDGGTIETMLPVKGEVYYRSCVGSTCRYSSDLWQAELYLNQLLAKDFS